MREELLKKLKALGDLNLYLKLKDKSDDVIKHYLKIKEEPKLEKQNKKTKKPNDERTTDTISDSTEE